MRRGARFRFPGSKTATLSDAFNAAWLADGQTLVYLSKTTGGLSQINAMRPADGKKRVLFDGFTFAAVAWDTKRNQAFAIEQNTRLVGPPKIMQLDLVAERVTELGSVEEYAGFLTVAPSARKIAYFKDGDTLEVRDVVGRREAGRGARGDWGISVVEGRAAHFAKAGAAAGVEQFGLGGGLQRSV